MATPFRLKRSAVPSKRPILGDIQHGELAINFYDGHLFAKRDTQGVGIGTTVALLTPWIEDFGGGKISYIGDRVIIDGTNSIQIPVGTTAQRDNVGTAVTGQIRYNKTTSSFEGFGSGGSWGSLGGIKDVDQDTYITAESAAGADEDTLTFFTEGTAKVVITPAGHVGIGTITPNTVAHSSNTKILNVGVVTANTYHGDQIIGTPTGGSFRAGAYTPVVTEKTKDSIDELNYILGKLVPDQPTTMDGVSLSLTSLNGNGGQTSAYLCAGFIATNNTGGAAPDQTGSTAYSRNTDQTITTNWLTEYGPGDSGTVTGHVNAVGVGTTTLNISFGLYAVKSDNGTYGSLQIANDKDATDSTRNVGITSLFYEVCDRRLVNAACPNGFNKAHMTHGSATTGSVYWYEDPSTVTAPDMTFGTVTTPDPASHQVVYSSGVPHYTNTSANTFSYVITVTNCTGDMYYSNHNRLLWAEGATTGFTRPSQYKFFSEMKVNGVSGTHPPQRNFGVGVGATVTVSHTPNNIHNTITSNHFHRWDCWTPYGNDLNERATISQAVNIMGGNAITSQVDEDNINITGSLGVGSGKAVRTTATSIDDNPTPSTTAFNANTTPPAVYEAIVRGGTLRHDQTNYASGYLPVGPNLGSGRSGAQYFQVFFTRTSVSEFNINVTGTYTGCWVCMPDNSTWTTGLNSTNGWANMFAAYSGSGTPNNANPGCSDGGAMGGSSGTFKCVFGEESSSNGAGKILVRFKLLSGQSISTMSFSAT